MKLSNLLIALFFSASIAHAQQAGQLYIASYNDTLDIGYICNGVNQDTASVSIAGVNLIPSVPITVDSITMSVKPVSDTVNFQYLGTSNPFTISNGGFFAEGPNWAATRVGDDTLILTGYYGGHFTSTADLIFHARNSPDISMYGVQSTLIDVGGGNKIGGFNQEEETDTMHDVMNAGEPYNVTSLPVENGGELEGDNPVILRSCSGGIIDSIVESGDFSEFAFDPFPKLPDTLKEEDTMILNYEFTPQVVDTLGVRHHYLIFHTKEGKYLSWSFEYRVYPSASVSDVAILNDQIKVFPNPASDELQVLGGQAGTIHLFDIMGRERLNASDDGTTATLDVSHLEHGTYFLRLGNQSTKVQISR
jgi:hypothetical protein